jgi:predicted metal-dependent hydrolase
MAPASVRRSVIAHEVAHMRHMNHSPDFYAWLDVLFEGNRKAGDQWLKMHGTGLQRVGR